MKERINEEKRLRQLALNSNELIKLYYSNQINKDIQNNGGNVDGTILKIVNLNS